MNRNNFLKTLAGTTLAYALPLPASELKIESSPIVGPARKLVTTNIALLLEKWKKLLDFNGYCGDERFYDQVTALDNYTCDTQNPRIMCAIELENLECDIRKICDNDMRFASNKWGKSYFRCDGMDEIVSIECDILGTPEYTHPAKIMIPETRKAWSPNYGNGWLRWYDLKLLENGEVIKIKRNTPRIGT